MGCTVSLWDVKLLQRFPLADLCSNCENCRRILPSRCFLDQRTVNEFHGAVLARFSTGFVCIVSFLQLRYFICIRFDARFPIHSPWLLRCSDNWSLRAGIVFASTLNLLCAFSRFIAEYLAPNSAIAKFSIIMLGQCLGALAQPFFTNSPANVSGVWFPGRWCVLQFWNWQGVATQRDVATTVAVMLNPLGNAAAALVPALIVTSSEDIQTLYIVQLVFIAAITFAVFLFFKDRSVVMLVFAVLFIPRSVHQLLHQRLLLSANSYEQPARSMTAQLRKRARYPQCGLR